MRRLREVTVKEKFSVTPSLIRLVLAGQDLHDFPTDQASGYIKFVFPCNDDEQLQPDHFENKNYMKSLRQRTFTIFAFDTEKSELIVDGIAHSYGADDQGPANKWLQAVEPGSTTLMLGPGEKKLIKPGCDWNFLVGDMTALPAIIVNLEQMPADAKGYAVIEVIGEDDIQELNRPAGMEVYWVVNGAPKTPNSLLADKARSLPWLDGNPAVWVAGEFSMMRNLRAYFKKEKALPTSDVYASSYWKIGESDEGNKKAKRLFVEELGEPI